MVSRLRRAITILMIVLALGMASCGGDRNAPAILLEGDEATLTTNPLVGAIAEVSPPERIQQLKPFLDVYEPQVRITSPHNNDLLEDTTVTVELQIRDFPIYKDADLGFGPHVHVFLDDRPYEAVYDTAASLVFTDLAPGTHTLRALAVRPWGESFKNEGAYDQVTFDVFTASPQNNPDDGQPLLTYGQPQESYGAEPIMLDFYLKNAPLHIVAENDEAIADWRLRCTVNGESFVFDRWQPIYLKGFRPGKNWIKLEVIDENGSLIDNAFNTGIRVIDYTPGGDDGLSQLVRGEIPLSQAKVLVDPNYVPPAPAEEAPPLEAMPEATVPEQEVPEAPAEALPTPAPEVPALTDEPETTEEKATTEAIPTENLSEPEPPTGEAVEEPSLDVSSPDSNELDTLPKTAEEPFDSTGTEPEAEEPETEEPASDASGNVEDALETPVEPDTAEEFDASEGDAIAPNTEPENQSSAVDENSTDTLETPSPEIPADSLDQPSELPAAPASESSDTATEGSNAVEPQDDNAQTPTDLDGPESELDSESETDSEDAPAPTNPEAEFDFI
ncbi:MAG: hypothetical protein ACFBSF_09375 [Leptolyngbyaceae cyanobacterium]